MSSDANHDDNNESSKSVKIKWINRNRVLIFCARGAAYRDRHLMLDLKTLMPHAKGESKLNKDAKRPLINEIAQMQNCTNCLFFENRKHSDLYMWAAHIGDGPSVKFLVHNVHTMDELRLSGNCLKGSRPILSFDASFDKQPHLMLIKQLFIQIFTTPNHHPKSQPFVDHVFTFSLTADGFIWFRNFQIVSEKVELQEIGPRMVLEIIRIFNGSFEGSVIYDNPTYKSPNIIRRQAKLASAGRYMQNKSAQESLKERKEKASTSYPIDPLDAMFDTSKEIVVGKRTIALQGGGKNKKRKLAKKARMTTDGPEMA